MRPGRKSGGITEGGGWIGIKDTINQDIRTHPRGAFGDHPYAQQ